MDDLTLLTYDQYLTQLMSQWVVPYLIPVAKVLGAVALAVVAVLMALAVIRAVVTYGPRIAAACLLLAVAVAVGWVVAELAR